MSLPGVPPEGHPACRVKICGLRRPEDVEAVNRALPEYAGFVFAPGRRRVSAEEAARLRRDLDPRVAAVGVFVDEDPAVIAGLLGARIIAVAQLHGREDAGYIRLLRERCGCPIIKAVRVGEAPPALDGLPAPPTGPDYPLFDAAPAGGPPGGSGRTFDWSLLHGCRGRPFFLAGGLTSANVAEAIRRLSPFAVDASSGVETDGQKDAGKIREFVGAVRACRHGINGGR